jgi:fatty acid desaturase
MDIGTNTNSVPAGDGRPVLPRAFYRASMWELVGFALHGALLWIVPAGFAVWLWGTAAPLAVKLVAMVACGWLSGHAIIFTQWIGHDAVHGSLPLPRKPAMWVGNFLSASIVGFQNMGFAAAHLDHHRHTNTSKDLDTLHYAKFKNVWTRMLFSRPTKNLVYMKAAAAACRGETKLPGLSLAESRALVVGNAIFSFLWFGLYGAILYRSTVAFFAFVALPTLSLVLSTGTITYQQHGGTERESPQDPWRTARSLTSRFWTFLYGGGNFHLEHHMYPGVAVWKLPAVHRYLKANGHFDKERLYLGSERLSGYRYALARFAYPDPAQTTATEPVVADP